MTNPEFSPNGKTGTLPIGGRNSSFRALVKCAIPSRTPAKLLLELRKHGIVQVRPNGRVRLVEEFFPLRARNAFDLELFTQLTSDFLRTHEVNILGNPRRGSGLFQRVAHRSKVDPRIGPGFDRYARKQGKVLLASIDDWLARHVNRERFRGRKGVRLGLGVYVINETVGT